MRKFWFVYLAKAVVLFPGGYGTLDEFFEMLTLVQAGLWRAAFGAPIPMIRMSFL